MDKKLTFPGGEPGINNADILFTQYSNREGIQGYANQFGNGIVKGCVLTATVPNWTTKEVFWNVTAGYAIINGELTKVNAQSGSFIISNNAPASYAYSYNVELAITTTYNPIGNKTYNDNTPRETWEEKRGIVHVYTSCEHHIDASHIQIGYFSGYYTPGNESITVQAFTTNLIDDKINDKIQAYNSSMFGDLYTNDFLTFNGSKVVGVTPHTYFTRTPDATNYDFQVGDFTIDDSWHDLDLSDIVPANAKLVLCRVAIRQGNTVFTGNSVPPDYNSWKTSSSPYAQGFLPIGYFVLNKKGANAYSNGSTVAIQTVNIFNHHDMWVEPDASRKIQYRTSGVDNIKLTVAGWIL